MKEVEKVTITALTLLTTVAVINIVRGVGIDDPTVEGVTIPLIGDCLVILAYLKLTAREGW